MRKPRRKPATASKFSQMGVHDCHIEMGTVRNGAEMKDAVVALARASEAHAVALQEISNMLKGSQVEVSGSAIHIGDKEQ